MNSPEVGSFFFLLLFFFSSPTEKEVGWLKISHYYLLPPKPGGGRKPGGGPPAAPPPKKAGGGGPPAPPPTVRTGADNGARVIGLACDALGAAAAAAAAAGRMSLEGGGASTLTETIVSPRRITSPILRFTSFVGCFFLARNSSVSASTRFINCRLLGCVSTLARDKK